MKKISKKIWFILRNKYVLSFIGLAVWIFFFDRYDMLSQIEMSKNLRQLESEKQYYILEIARNKLDKMELSTNKSFLEKFAREKYLMHKPNEEVFVFVEENTGSD